jgi:hypothetical protein
MIKTHILIYYFKILSINPTSEFLACLHGVVVEKRFKTNKQSNSINSTITNYELELAKHFDLLLPNREFKLLIRLEGDEEIDDNKRNNESTFEPQPKCVTVYFDTRFSLHQFCILPGMRVNVFNLIRKNENEYRSNTNMSVEFEQGLDLFNFKEDVYNVKSLDDVKLSQCGVIKKKNIFENLDQVDTIFECFYFKKDVFNSTKTDVRFEQLDANYRRKILFNNEYVNGNVSNDSQCVKILAQIVKIYEFCIRIKCRTCFHLANACHCNGFEIHKQIDISKYRIELEALFLIDDHTSVLKCNFADLDFDLK